MADSRVLQMLIYPAIISGIFAAIGWMAYTKSVFNPDEKYSTFWPRLWATQVDILVLWPINSFIPFILNYDFPALFAVCLWFIQSAGIYLYSVYMHGRYGQTLGKMVCHVKVLDFNGEKEINFKTAFYRDIVPIALFIFLTIIEIILLYKGELTFYEFIDSEADAVAIPFHLGILPSIWFAAEVLTMLTNKKRRAVHDYIAGTVVARTNIKDGP